MIPTFIIDEPILISIGLFSAYFIPKDWTGSPFKTRAFTAGTVVALGFMALAAYGYVVAPDWMFMYFVPASSVPAWMVGYAFALYYILFLAGFLLHRPLRQLHPALPHLALLGGLTASVLVILPLRHAYQTVASYAEFHQGAGIPLSQSPIGQHTLLPTLLLLAVGVGLFWWAKRQKERPTVK